MPFRVDRFGGVVPKTDPSKLPNEGAQQAHNCELTGGTISPVRIKQPVFSMHEIDEAEQLVLKAEIPSADVVFVDKPVAPTLNSIDYLADPTEWLTITARDWVTWIDNFGVQQNVMSRNQNLTMTGMRYTETGMQIEVFLPTLEYTFLNSLTPIFLRGPKYQFSFAVSAPNGPDQIQVFPVAASKSDPEFPSQQVPLIDANGNIYASFQVVDVLGPNYNEDIFVRDYEFVTWYLPDAVLGSYVLFDINMNYAVSQRRHFYYVQSMVDAQEREGPPSEISERFIIKPGQQLTLDTPWEEGFEKNRLYRSVTQGEDAFRLIDDIDATTYVDDAIEIKAEGIPRFGNFPGGDVDVFLEGSAIHPAQFGVAFFEKTLYMSDPNRLHAWPDEYTIPFQDDIKAIALSGNTVIVFSGNSVHAVTGSNPETMSKTLLSNDKPLLNKGSLCRIGSTIYFATYDGLAAVTGSGVEVITGAHFTRRQWLFYSPENMVAETADNSILLKTTTASETPTDGGFDVIFRPLGRLLTFPPLLGEPATEQFLRIDLDESETALTTYDTLDGQGTIIWHSKRFRFDQKTRVEYVQVKATAYPIEFTLFADRAEVGTFNIPDAFPFEIPYIAVTEDSDGETTISPNPHALEWEFLVRAERNTDVEDSVAPTIERVDLYERHIQMAGDEATFDESNTPLFKNLWFRYPDSGRPSIGILTAQTSETIQVKFYANGGELTDPNDLTGPTQVNVSQFGNPTYIAEVESGRPFLLPRTLTKAVTWRVNVDTNAHIDEFRVLRKQTQSVQESVREVNEGDIPPWMLKRYEFPDRVEMQSVIVHATKAVTLQLYFDDATTPSQTVAVPDNGEIRVAFGSSIRSVEFDFDGEDDAVSKVLLFGIKARQASTDAVAISGPPWRRNLIQFADRGLFLSGLLSSDDYTNCEIDVYVDGTLEETVEVESGNVFQFDRRKVEIGTRWEIDVKGPGNKEQLTLYPRRPAPINGKTIDLANTGPVPDWLFSQFRFEEETTLVSVRIEAEQAVQMRVWLDGKMGSPNTAPLIQPGVETLFELGEVSTIEFDFDGDDHLVHRVTVFGQETEAVSGSGISITDRRNWRKLRYKFPDVGTFAAFSLGAKDYTGLVVTLKADGVQVYSSPVTHGRMIAFDRGFAVASLWEVDIASPSDPNNFTMLQRQAVRAGDIIEETNSSGLPKWLYSRYEYLSPSQPRSLRVESDSYPLTLNIYCDGAATPTKTLSIPDDREYRIGLAAPCGSVEFDFEGDDHQVREFVVFTPSIQTIGDSGLNGTDPASWRSIPFQFEDAGELVSAYVLSSTYSGLTFRLYADGALVHTETVTDGNWFTLPRTLPKAKHWELDLDVDGEIRAYGLRPPVIEPVGGFRLRLYKEEGRTPKWLYTRFEWPDRAKIKALSVLSDSYPVTMTIRRDGASTTTDVAISGPGEVRVDDIPIMGFFEFDFGTDNGKIREIQVFADIPQLIGPNGIQLEDEPSFRGRLFKFADFGRMAAFSVGADDTGYSDARLTLYADGGSVHSELVTDGKMTVLPRTLPGGTEWEVDVSTIGEVHSVQVLPWRRKSVDGDNLSVMHDQSGIPEWLYTEYEFPDRIELKAIVVHASEDVTMRLYFDGATAPSQTQAITGPAEIRATSPQFSALSFHFDGEDDKVSEVIIYALDTRQGTIEPITFNGPTWRRNIVNYEDRALLACGVLSAGGYGDTEIDVYADNTFRETIDVNNGRVFRFARGLPAHRWELDVRGTVEKEQLSLYPRRPSPVDGKVLDVTHGGNVPRWLFERYEFAERTTVVSVIVEASQNVVMRIWLNGNTGAPDSTPTVFPGYENLFEMGKISTLEFDFNGADHAVRRVMVFGQEIESIGQGGISARNHRNWRKRQYKFTDAGTFAAFSLTADDYASVQLVMKADGTEVYNAFVSDGTLTALSRSFPIGTLWEVDIVTQADITGFEMLQRQAVEAGEIIRRTNASNLPVWLFERYQFDSPSEPRSVRVEAENYPVTMNVYLNGSVAPTSTVVIPNSREHRLALGATARTVEFDFNGQDHEIRDVSIFVPTIRVANEDGLTLNNPVSWRAIPFQFEDKGRLVSASVQASDYSSVIMRIYDGAGTLVHTETVTNGNWFTLPRTLSEGKLWEVDFDTAAEIQAAWLRPAKTEAIGSYQFGLTREETRTQRWLYTRWEWPDRAEIKAMTVLADSYPVTMTVRCDGATTPTKTFTFANAGEIRVAGFDLCGFFEFDFGADDGKIREIQIFADLPEVIGEAGIQLSKEATYRGRLFKFPDFGRMAAFSIGADDLGYQNAVLTLYADGGSVHSQAVTTGQMTRLPRTLPGGTEWEVDLATTGEIHSVNVLPWRRRALQDDLLRVTHDQSGVPEWMFTEFEYPDRIQLQSLVVHASRAVTMDLYFDGATTPSQTVAITGPTEIRATSPLFSSLSFDFQGDDDKVAEVIVYPLDVLQATLDPVVLRGPAWRQNVVNFQDRGQLACGVLSADDYDNAAIDVYADGVLRQTVSPSNGKVFILNRGLAAFRWEIDNKTPDDNEHLTLYPRRPVAVDGKTLDVANPGNVPPWLYSKYEFSERTEVVSVKVEAKQNVTMRVWSDGNTGAPDVSQAVIAGRETLIAVGRVRSIEFDFNGQDHLIQRVMVFGQVTEAIPAGGISITDRPNWRKLLYKFADVGTFAAFSLGADDYTSVQLVIKADGVEVFNDFVNAGKMTAFPRNLTFGTLWEIDLISDSELHNFVMLQRAAERFDDIITETNTSSLPVWLYKRYEMVSPSEPRSVRVEASSYPVTMNVYCDGAVNPTKTLSIPNSREHRLGLGQICGSIEFDFNGNDHLIREVSLFNHEVQTVGEQGLVLRNPVSWRAIPFQFEDKGKLVAVSVQASNYSSVVMRLYDGAGALAHTQSITNGDWILLPRTLAESKLWEVDFDTAAEIQAVWLRPSTTVPVEGFRLSLTREETKTQRWLYTTWEWPDRAEIKAMTVLSDSYPVTMNIRKDGATTPSSFTFSNAGEIRVAGLGLAGRFEFDFGSDNGKIREVMVFADIPRLIGPEGIQIEGDQTYRGRQFKFPDAGRMAAFSIGADQVAYADMRLRLYANNTLVYNELVTNGRFVRLPINLAEATTWEVDIETTGEVHSFLMMPWQRRSTGGEGAHVLNNSGAIPEWLYTEYEFGSEVEIRSGFIRSDSYPVTLRVFKDGGITPSTENIADGKEALFATAPKMTTLVFDFNGDDRKIHEVFLFPVEHVPMQSAGFFMRSGSGSMTPWRNKSFSFNDLGSFSVIRVKAQNYTGMTAALIANGTTQDTVTISDSGEIRFDADLPNARDWYLDLVHEGRIDEVVLISRQVTRASSRLVRVRQQDDPFTWIDQRVITPRPLAWTVGRLVADDYPQTFRLKANGTIKVERTISDDKPFRLPVMQPQREWTFDVESSNASQTHEVSLATSMGALDG